MAPKTYVNKKTTQKKNVRRINRRKMKQKGDSFSRYLFKILKIMHPDLSISKQSMSVMNSFIQDIFQRIAVESSFLVNINKNRTLTSREIQTAVLLVVPGALGRQAVTEGAKAIAAYTNSKY